MKNFLIGYGLLVCTLHWSQAQVESPYTIRKGFLYKQERFLDLAIQTNGFFVGYNLGKIKTYQRSYYTHLDLGLLEHPREQKIHRSFHQSNGLFNSYTYGKQHSLWNIRAGRGLVHYFSEKARTKGIAIGLRLEGGLILGLLKPYYIKILKNVDGVFYVEHIRYDEEHKELFLNQSLIIGASPFRKGLGELRIRPGAYGRVSVSFDPGAYDRLVRALNIGFCFDVYPGSVPIMVSEKNPFFFPNFFINLQIGSRSTRNKGFDDKE